MSYKALFLDCDGTLADTLAFWDDLAIVDLQERGISPTDDLLASIADMTLHQAADWIRQRYQLSLSTDRLLSAWQSRLHQRYAQAKAKTGALAFLRSASKAACPTLVLTLSPSELILPLLGKNNLSPWLMPLSPSTDVIKDLPQNAMLKALPQGLVSGHDLHLGKENPQIFFFAAKALSLSPQECLVVDDSLFALRTAHAAGFPTAAFYDPHHSSSDWMKSQALADHAFLNWQQAEEVLFPHR